MIERPDLDTATKALRMVETAGGFALEPERREELAQMLAAGDWVVDELAAATNRLMRDKRLVEDLRYGRTLGLPHFEEARANAEGVPYDDVARRRLYRRHEALSIWQKRGEPGVFSDAVRADGALRTYPDSVFTVVRVSGEDGLFFRMK